MPPCIKGDKCQCPTAELEKRHFCAICKEELHGPCGIFNGDDSAITYRNRCSYCSVDGSKASGVKNDPSTQQSALISSKDVDPRNVLHWLGETRWEKKKYFSAAGSTMNWTGFVSFLWWYTLVFHHENCLPCSGTGQVAGRQDAIRPETVWLVKNIC